VTHIIDQAAAHDAYWGAVETADRHLDAVLTVTRGRQDLGALTPQDAAQERIDAMQEHLDKVTALRTQYLGGAA
jgi:hypothetical protein